VLYSRPFDKESQIMKFNIGTVLLSIGVAYIALVIFHLIRQSMLLNTMAILGGAVKPSVFIVAGMLLKLISKKDNFMNNKKGHIKSSLLVSLFAIYFTAVGVIWSFLFFSTEPAINAGYIIAFVYYLIGASIIISLIYFKFGKPIHQSEESVFSGEKLYWSDTIIKYLTFGMATLFVFGGFYLTLVTFAHLKRNSSMILLGILFFMSSLIVTVTMLYKVKKVRE
jgi:hypothetical protein